MGHYGCGSNLVPQSGRLKTWWSPQWGRLAKFPWTNWPEIGTRYICPHSIYVYTYVYLIHISIYLYLYILRVIYPSYFHNISTLPSGKLSHNYGKIHHFSWENSLFLWPFSENHHFSWENPLSMAIFNSYVDITRGYPQWSPRCVSAAASPAARRGCGGRPDGPVRRRHAGGRCDPPDERSLNHRWISKDDEWQYFMGLWEYDRNMISNIMAII